ncbi:DUF551 domain-containing protein [Pectobacterium betavasculorum]|uniref:DUF551 domain-containing protein n=1 Tax=Pectobacterium betavasculorum TaxID=55207 RepID=UPI00313DB0DF
MKWISVDDSLPNPGLYRVIVATDKGIGSASYNPYNGFQAVTLNGSTQYSHLNVTHWMKFPEAPEK